MCVCVQHVLVLPYPDVDSLCACKILQTLFKADTVPHTVVSVAGRAELKTAFSTHQDKVSFTHTHTHTHLLTLCVCVCVCVCV